MILSQKLRLRIIVVASLFASIILCVMIFRGVKDNNKTASIPIASRDIENGEAFSENNIRMIECGSYNLSEVGIVTAESELKGKYAGVGMKSGSAIRKSDLSKVRSSGLAYQVKSEVITISTSMAKCVGGKFGNGDFVRARIVQKGPDGIIISDPPELSKLKVVSVLTKSGEEWAGAAKKSYGIGEEPAYVTLEADKSQQSKLLLGEYYGFVHFSLIPKKSSSE